MLSLLDFVSPYQVLCVSWPLDYCILRVSYDCHCFPSSLNCPWPWFSLPYLHFLGYLGNCHGYQCPGLAYGRSHIHCSTISSLMNSTFLCPQGSSTWPYSLKSSLGVSEAPPPHFPIVPSQIHLSLHFLLSSQPASLSSTALATESSRVSSVCDVIDVAPRIESFSNGTVAVFPPQAHCVVSEAQDGALPLRWFTVSQHPTAFTVSSDTQEPRTFSKARNDPRWQFSKFVSLYKADYCTLDYSEAHLMISEWYHHSYSPY